jgi:hypothetical protein
MLEDSGVRGKVVSALIECAESAGHEIQGWRCKWCLRTLQEILSGGSIPKLCQSPDDGRFLFLGGPMHGEWMHVPPESGGYGLRPFWHVAICPPMTAKVWEEENLDETVLYEEFVYQALQDSHPIGKREWPMIVYWMADR